MMVSTIFVRKSTKIVRCTACIATIYRSVQCVSECHGAGLSVTERIGADEWTSSIRFALIHVLVGGERHDLCDQTPLTNSAPQYTMQ